MAILTVPSESELDGLVAAYDLGQKRSARGIEAGTVNTSYVLELDSGRYFLRIYEEQGAAGAEAEARLLLHLAAAGVPTPAPVAGRDGAMVRVVAGKPAAVFPWVTGDMLCLPSVTCDAATAVGRALARMHLAGPAPAPAPPLGGGRFGADELVARCDRVAKSSDPEARVQAEPLRDAIIRIDRRRRTDLPSGLVHGDLFRDNVLWHEGKIAALLDFESAHKGPFAYDLAVTILSWSYRDAFDFDLARAILDGYREVRELAANELEGLYAETVFGALRFTVTRITDDAIRVGKRWQRFVERREALEQLGPAGLREALGL
jgi:homoserine kinase type II